MQRFGLPGMRVLQFGFDGNPANPHLPYQHLRDCVVYTGTHDNDTTLGWYRSLDPPTTARVDFFLRAGAASMPEPLIRAALGSVAQLAVLPVQDLLGLGSEARLNTPGTIRGNWQWRVPPGALSTRAGAALRTAEPCLRPLLRPARAALLPCPPREDFPAQRSALAGGDPRRLCPRAEAAGAAAVDRRRPAGQRGSVAAAPEAAHACAQPQRPQPADQGHRVHPRGGRAAVRHRRSRPRASWCRRSGRPSST